MNSPHVGRITFGPREPTQSYLAARLTLTRAELQVCREQLQVLRVLVEGLRGIAEIEAAGGSLAWRKALVHIDNALEATQ